MSAKEAVFSFALLMLFMSGCSDDDPVATQESASLPPELVATWSFSSVTQNGTAASLRDALGLEPNTAKVTMTLNNNSTFDYVEVTDEGEKTYQSSGTFTVDGQAFSLVGVGSTHTTPPVTAIATSSGPPKTAGSLTGTWRHWYSGDPDCGSELVLTATTTEFVLSNGSPDSCPDW